MKKRRIGTVAATSLLAVTGVVGMTATPASAAGQDGVVNTNEMVFYYNSGCVNSRSDFAAAKANLAGYVFLTNGAGKGQAVKNNSACVWNTKAQYAQVFFNSNYQGPDDLVPPNTIRDLTNTYNENASFKWI